MHSHNYSNAPHIKWLQSHSHTQTEYNYGEIKRFTVKEPISDIYFPVSYQFVGNRRNILTQLAQEGGLQVCQPSLNVRQQCSQLLKSQKAQAQVMLTAAQGSQFGARRPYKLLKAAQAMQYTKAEYAVNTLAP